jgi:hypothetical protein
MARPLSKLLELRDPGLEGTQEKRDAPQQTRVRRTPHSVTIELRRTV